MRVERLSISNKIGAAASLVRTLSGPAVEFRQDQISPNRCRGVRRTLHLRVR